MELKTMAWKKSLLRLTALSLGMSLELAIMAIGSAQAGVSNSISQRTWQVSQFNPPDRGAPTTAVGGASRGGVLICNEIAALSPESTIQNVQGKKPYLGLTVSQQPSFLFYTKGSKEYAGGKIIFILYELGVQIQNRPGYQEIYQTEFDLPDESGTFAVNLPSNVVLEEGKSYQWYMELLEKDCASSEDAPEAAWMNGFIERVEETPTLKNDLAMAKNTVERSEVYGEAGIWFDALNVLAQERRTANTPELEASWQALLQYAAIEDELKNSVFNAELIDCCSVESAGDASELTTHN
jgi:hypothetical protein